MAERVIDGTDLDAEAVGRAVTDLCDAAAEIDAAGDYPAIDVQRPWSVHNPMITGEFARPNAIRSYLERELHALLTMGATVTVRPSRPAVAIVDIGAGPSNAKTVTDHLAVLRPDAVLMIGHCGGLRNHQEIGDYVLATAYLRDDRILDAALPTTIPVIPNHLLNRYLLTALDARDARYRVGTVLTTANRNWELEINAMWHTLEQSRAVAVDMESATIATNGFRYRIPNATLLCVSDKPLHGSPKLAGEARRFYEASRRVHLEIALECIDHVRRNHPGGIPNADLR